MQEKIVKRNLHSHYLGITMSIFVVTKVIQMINNGLMQLNIKVTVVYLSACISFCNNF